jgi:hypothetical protein
MKKFDNIQIQNKSKKNKFIYSTLDDDEDVETTADEKIQKEDFSLPENSRESALILRALDACVFSIQSFVSLCFWL